MSSLTLRKPSPLAAVEAFVNRDEESPRDSVGQHEREAANDAAPYTELSDSDLRSQLGGCRSRRDPL